MDGNVTLLTGKHTPFNVAGVTLIFGAKIEYYIKCMQPRARQHAYYVARRLPVSATAHRGAAYSRQGQAARGSERDLTHLTTRATERAHQISPRLHYFEQTI